MTAAEGTTMNDAVIVERERLAAEAYERIRSGNHWRDWTFVAAGFEAGRDRAMREAHTNQAMGRGYNTAFSSWMRRNPWSMQIDKATRSHCLWVADNLPSIEAWREALAANQRDQWNHPTPIKRQYERAQKVATAKAAGEEAPLSPMAQLKAKLVELEGENDRLKRQVRDGGSLFDLQKDTAKNIANLIVSECTPSRVDSLIKELRAALKAKTVHAG